MSNDIVLEIIGHDGAWLGVTPTFAIAEHVCRQNPGSVIVTIVRGNVTLVGSESART